MAAPSFDDTADFEDADRGFVGAMDPVRRARPTTGG